MYSVGAGATVAMAGQASAIGDELGPGRKGALLGSEEEHESRDFFGLPDARDRLGGEDCVLIDIRKIIGVDHGRVHTTRMDGVDANPIGAKFEGGGLRHAANRPFTGDVWQDPVEGEDGRREDGGRRNEWWQFS